MNRTTHTRSRCAWLLIGTVMVIGMQSGCASRPGVIFEPLATPLAWPAPPEPERVRYVGQLTTSADLKPGVSLGQRIGSALFGKKPIYSMLSPYAICTDGRQRLYVADSNGQFVHVFDLKTRAYARLRPPSPEGRFTQPVGIAHDPAGRLFVTDAVAQCVYVFSDRGGYLGELGRGIVARPAGLAFDPQNDRLIVADPAAHQLVVLSGEGQLLSRVGRRGTALGEFNYPTNVAIDSRGRVYVSDSLNFRVQQFDTDLRPLRQIGSKGDRGGYFGQPKGLALDSLDHLYVVDAHFEAVQIFDNEGRFLMGFGREGRAPGEFWLPAGIFIDPSDRIWIADTYNRRVQVFDFVGARQP